MKVKEGFVICEVGGKTVAVASGALAAEFHGMISLNTTGQLLFKHLQKGTTTEEMAKALVEEYDISMENALADTEKFVSSLRKANLIED